MAPPVNYQLFFFSDDEHKELLFLSSYSSRNEMCKQLKVNQYTIQNIFKTKPKKLSLKVLTKLNRVAIKKTQKKRKTDKEPVVKWFNKKEEGKYTIREENKKKDIKENTLNIITENATSPNKSEAKQEDI